MNITNSFYKINTCSFIESSREQSIDTIFEFLDLKQKNLKKLIVTGCLIDSNEDEIRKEIPEIDHIVNLKRIYELYKDFGFIEENRNIYYNNRTLINKSSSYLKISEGCNKRCSFCTIPLFKGNLKSRSIDSLKKEAEILSKNGVEEINLVAQDLTEYGEDINENIVSLLDELESVDGIKWIRLLYTYPTLITDALIDKISSSSKICSYIDIPLQHTEDKMLKMMNRKGSSTYYYKLIEKLRDKIPHISIRSTFIVGFPGETDEMFQHLYDSLQKLKLDRVGVFPYSYEEDTPSAKLPNHIEEEIKQERVRAIMELQEDISEINLKKRLNTHCEVLIEEKVKTQGNEIPYYIGRSEFEAPEVDGNIIIRSRNLKIGKFYEVKIVDTFTHDLLGEIVS